MKLYYAHYPSLEDHLVRFVQKNRQSPVDKWLVIASSSLVSGRLQNRLARELGALANIHFLTGSALVGRLDSECPGSTLPLLPQNHVRDYLIKGILSEPGLDRYPVSRGFIQAVKSALRDLEDSLVTPEVLEEHWGSLPDTVLEQDGGRFEWLIKLYARYREKENTVPGYRSYQQAFERALGHVEQSRYLQGFSCIIIYGFYDMTGRQLELLNRVCSCYPVTVFAPYEKHPAYSFAKKFFESNWLSVPGAEDVNAPHSGALEQSESCLFAGGGSAPNERVTITSVPDARGGVFYTAKEILSLHEAGVSYGDMAVIVRALPPYQDEIRRVFKDNCLPLDSSFTYPFTHYALGVFCQNLLGLAASGFSREKVLFLFSSPYFKQSAKPAWRRLVQQSSVKRDLSQWQDLLPQDHEQTPAVQAWIEQTAKQLHALNQSQPWKRGAASLWNFLQSQIDVSAFQGKDYEIFQTIQETLQQLETYQVIRENCREEELLREATEALSDLTFNEAESIRGGITLTDAVRARGLNFKYVFVLGLNDKEFPVVTAEDPILRDYYRIQLRDTLGYWINPSLDRGDEEKLLFYNAVTAAREKLYVCYVRYGQDGKPAVPSVYAAELARVCEINLQAQNAPRVSGRISERLGSYPTAFLTPKEVSCQIILRSRPQENYQLAGLLSEQKTRTLTAAQKISQTGPLGDYDGMIQSGAQIFARENARGFSPSALQEIGACPLKYFFDKGLHLGEPDEPASRHELAADKRGSVYHEILQDFYQTLYEKKLTHTLFDTGVTAYMEQSISKFYTPSSYKLFGIYPVVWELILENICEKLTDFAKEDIKNTNDFTPTVFEQEVSIEPTAEFPVKLRGIIDRIDVREATQEFYVVDYKSSRKSSGGLVRDLFKQLLLQPFIYVLLAKTLPQLRGYQSAGSCLLAIGKYQKAELSSEEFAAIYDKARNFLIQLTQLIQTGSFFMCPSDLCKYCPYTLLCRKDAFRPLLRSRKSAQLRALEEARQ
ncbi:MAG: exodeoxyribonuclease V subunit gamma [Elusimicrobiaceae bacterium]|nr:exodeoxyribonuclease V subunit gamma [Elusimicrobiaceae bacterium]